MCWREQREIIQKFAENNMKSIGQTSQMLYKIIFVYSKRIKRLFQQNNIVRTHVIFAVLTSKVRLRSTWENVSMPVSVSALCVCLSPTPSIRKFVSACVTNRSKTFSFLVYLYISCTMTGISHG